MRKATGDLQLELGTPLTVGLSSVEHVYSVLESGLDNVFSRISVDRVTDGEPYRSKKATSAFVR